MNNFTPRAQQVLALARKEADRFNHNYVGTEHVLLGIIRLGQGVAVNVLMKLGLDLETVRLEVEKQVGSGPDTRMSGNIPYTPRVKKILALAGKEAKRLNHSYVGTEHILLGILAEGDGVSARILRTLEVDIERTRAEIIQELDPNSIGGNRYPERQQLLGSTEPNAAYAARRADAFRGGDAAPAAPRPNLPIAENPPHPAIAPYLAPGEKLFWSGERKRKFRLERKHFPLLFILPFFLFFLVAALTGIFDSGAPAKTGKSAAQEQTATATAGAPDQSAKPPPPLPVRIFFALFVVIMLGGFFSFMATIMGLNPGDVWRGDVFYGISDQRLIMISGRRNKTVRAIYLGSLTDLRMKEWPDGLGQITFGPEQVWPYRAPFRDTDTQLENISNPRHVFQLLIAARRAA